MKMNELKLVYFSPTGTTRKVIMEVAKNIDLKSVSFDFSVHKEKRPTLTFMQNDFVLFGIPVYAGRVPRTFIEYLEQIHGNDTPAALIATYGCREYEDALQWLVDARLVHKIYRSTAPGLPIAAYDDLPAFKIYLVDVGLLRRLAQLAPTAFGEGNRLFTEFKGALTENYVLQSLISQFEVTPRYWTQTNPPYEVDFLIQRENDIFPIEVKSEANTSSKSLKKFKELFPDQVKLRIRFSLDNLKLDGDVLNIPLFMADQADRLIGLALNRQNGNQ